MTTPSRRSFLTRAGAGAAALGLAAVTPKLVGTSSPAQAAPDLKAAAGSLPLVAHIKDAATGDISLLVGEREVILHDHAIVARLTRAIA